jgi:hypothetical protein
MIAMHRVSGAQHRDDAACWVQAPVPATRTFSPLSRSRNGSFLQEYHPIRVMLPCQHQTVLVIMGQSGARKPRRLHASLTHLHDVALLAQSLAEIMQGTL